MAAPSEQSILTVGDIRLHFLPDGHGRFVPNAMFAAATPEALQQHPQYLDEAGRFPVSIGSFLIERGDQNALVDTGFGAVEMDVEGFASMKSGDLLKSLAAAGLQPEDVQRVVFTHLHGDHVGWTVNPDTGAPVFPRATHYVGKGEREHWVGSTEDFAPAQPVQDLLGRNGTAVADGEEIIPGVTIVETPGHTPGHISLVVASGTGRAMILGDVVHCPVQLERADWEMFADVDPKLAKQTRDRLWAELEGSPTVAAGGHMSDYVFGRVAPAQGKRQWLMAEGVTASG
jgi:glyoxylase-like metal-dependent hydrolase (beta-lactamase superfamily II)